MENCEIARAELARATGLSNVAPDGDGVIQLIVGEGQPLFIREIGEHAIDVSARVPAFGESPDASVKRRMLVWTMQNAPLRLGLEDGKGVVLGLRIDVRRVDGRGMTAQIANVATTAARLHAKGTVALPSDPAVYTPGSMANFQMIRI